jgi:hypothetical protein
MKKMASKSKMKADIKKAGIAKKGFGGKKK